MARTVDHKHREALVNAVATHLVATGSSGASLRELADRAGTSARMLVHHFGTRDSLVDAALEIARDRQLAAAHTSIAPAPDAIATLTSVWEWFERSDTRQYFALFTDVAARARAHPEREPDRRFTSRLGSDWRPLFECVFQSDTRFVSDATALALIVIGVLRGFALDLDDRGDATHQQAAFTTLVELIAAHGGHAAQ